MDNKEINAAVKANLGSTIAKAMLAAVASIVAGELAGKGFDKIAERRKNKTPEDQ